MIIEPSCRKLNKSAKQKQLGDEKNFRMHLDEIVREKEEHIMQGVFKRNVQAWVLFLIDGFPSRKIFNFSMILGNHLLRRVDHLENLREILVKEGNTSFQIPNRR